MNEPSDFEPADPESTARVDETCDRFEVAWRAGHTPRIEDYLEDWTEPQRSALLRELVLLEIELSGSEAEVPTSDEWIKRFPDHGKLVQQIIGEFPTEQLRIKSGESKGDSDTAESLASTSDTVPKGRLEPGAQIGDYELLQRFSSGGMGIVYRARQISADRVVALKFIREDHIDRSDTHECERIIERFRTEARAMARLEHDHLVTVYDVGEVDGRNYYSMQFVDGSSLQELVKHQPLENRRAARYVAGAARAVHVAHKHGILHRDLKPHNIMIDRSTDRALVTDFGLARLRTRDQQATHAGEVFGSPPYMSPEQARDASSVTASTDVYGLGATLYQLLTTSPPFQGKSSPETLRMVAEKVPNAPRSVNPDVDYDLETICLKCLEKDPGARFASAEELADELERYLDYRPIRSRRVGVPGRVYRWIQRNPQLARLTVAMLILLVAGVCLATYTVFTRQASELTDAVNEIIEADVSSVDDVVTKRRTEVDEDLLRDRLEQDFELGSDHSPAQLNRALALHLVGVPKTEFLLDHMLDANAEQFFALRDALETELPAKADRLWRELDDPKGNAPRRMRAAMALAEMHPQRMAPPKERWEAHGPFIVGQLISWLLNEPDEYQQFAPTLRSLADDLYASVHQATLAGGEPERPRRCAAASVAADFYPDDVAKLARIVVEGEADVYDIVMARLRRQGDAAKEYFRSVLRRLPERPSPPPLAPQTIDPSDDLLKRFEAAHGAVTERFAICQTLPFLEFAEVADEMGRNGYRPTKVRPFLLDGRLVVAALWNRDGSPWRFTDAVAPERIDSLSNKLADDGLFPIDAAGYVVPELPKDGPRRRYCALWSASKRPNTADVRPAVVIGISARRPNLTIVKKMRQLIIEDFVAITAHAFSDEETLWQSFVYEHSPSTKNTNVFGNSVPYLNVTSEELKTSLQPWNYHLDVSGVSFAQGVRYWAVIWGIRESESVVDFEIPLKKLAAKIPRRAAAGFRPSSISVVVPPAGDRKPLTTVIWSRRLPTEASKDILAAQQARAAKALSHLGESSEVLPLLRHAGDPRLQTELVHRLSADAMSPQVLMQQFVESTDVTIRQAALLTLGSYALDSVPESRRLSWLPELLRAFDAESDAGVHAAIRWVLVQWGFRDEITRAENKLRSTTDRSRDWYVNGQGHTMVVVTAASPFLMGSPENEELRRRERQHMRSIGRTFSMSQMEVTMAQIKKCAKHVPDWEPAADYSRAPDCPANSVTFFEAARYCNWLSEQEGIPRKQWVYPDIPRNATSIQLPDGYLNRTGYRLPTEAEWEYACRAGSTTRWSFGNSLKMLGHYAWYVKNSGKVTQPVGLLKPNRFGLFDMAGNIGEWVHAAVDDYSASPIVGPLVDRGGPPRVAGNWVFRGGAAADSWPILRAAKRHSSKADFRANAIGFRVTRTEPTPMPPR